MPDMTPMSLLQRL